MCTDCGVPAVPGRPIAAYARAPRVWTGATVLMSVPVVPVLATVAGMTVLINVPGVGVLPEVVPLPATDAGTNVSMSVPVVPVLAAVTGTLVLISDDPVVVGLPAGVVVPVEPPGVAVVGVVPMVVPVVALPDVAGATG